MLQPPNLAPGTHVLVPTNWIVLWSLGASCGCNWMRRWTFWIPMEFLDLLVVCLIQHDLISCVIELHHDFLPLAICSGIRIFFVVSFVFISSEIFNESFNELSTTDWRYSYTIPIANHEQHQHKISFIIIQIPSPDNAATPKNPWLCIGYLQMGRFTIRAMELFSMLRLHLLASTSKHAMDFVLELDLLEQQHMFARAEFDLLAFEHLWARRIQKHHLDSFGLPSGKLT